MIRLTTLPGLEAFVEAETREILSRPVASSVPAAGCVDLELPEGDHRALLCLRTVLDVLLPIATRRVDLSAGLDGVRAETEAVAPSIAPRGASFRVRSERRDAASGRRRTEHGFNRVDLERAVGGVVHRVTGLPVRLEDPEWILRADLDGDELRFAHLLTHRPLGRRPGPFTQRVGLAPPLAAAAVRLAGGPSPSVVLDPFCGSGTLLVEAGWAHPAARLVGGDWSRAAALGARSNLEAMGFSDRAEIAHRDARALAADLPAESVDLLLTNPPFGLRIGRRIRFVGFYRRLLAAARVVLRPGVGRVVLLVHKTGQLEEAAAREGFVVAAAHPVRTGEARPTLVRLEP